MVRAALKNHETIGLINMELLYANRVTTGKQGRDQMYGVRVLVDILRCPCPADNRGANFAAKLCQTWPDKHFVQGPQCPGIARKNEEREMIYSSKRHSLAGYDRLRLQQK